MSDTILVTGGAGFVGSHLCEALAEYGARVWALDSFDDHYNPARKRRNLAPAASRAKVHVVEGDVRDSVLMGGLFSDVAFDAVVHLAGLAGTSTSADDPDACYEANVRGTLRVLEAMGRHDVPRFVLASSTAVYREDSADSVSEDAAADRPTSLLGASKRAAELMAHAYHTTHDLAVHCLRLSDVYGPRQPPDTPLHAIARQMASGEPVSDFGIDGSRRNHVHVNDAVNAFRLSIDHLLERDDAVYEVIDVRGGHRLSREELISALGAAMGTRTRDDPRPKPPRDGAEAPASLEKARELLGYRPTVGLEEGLGGFVEWLRRDRSTETEAGSTTADERLESLSTSVRQE